MIPKSTKPGAAVLAFPDVCFAPMAGAGAPVPVAYPNMARIPQTSTQAKVTTTVKAPTLLKSVNYSSGSLGDAAGVMSSQCKGAAAVPSLRNQLDLLHSQLSRLAAGDPNRWHELIDEYVQVTANLYVTLVGSNRKVP